METLESLCKTSPEVLLMGTLLQMIARAETIEGSQGLSVAAQACRGSTTLFCCSCCGMDAFVEPERPHCTANY